MMVLEIKGVRLCCRAAAEESVVPWRHRPGPAGQDLPGAGHAKPGQLAGLRLPATVRGVSNNDSSAPTQHLPPGTPLLPHAC